MAKLLTNITRLEEKNRGLQSQLSVAEHSKKECEERLAQLQFSFNEQQRLQEVELDSVRVREDKRVNELVQQLEQEAKARAKCESELEI